MHLYATQPGCCKVGFFSFNTVLCDSQGYSTGCQHSGERCQICYECWTQKKVGRLSGCCVLWIAVCKCTAAICCVCVHVNGFCLLLFLLKQTPVGGFISSWQQTKGQVFLFYCFIYFLQCSCIHFLWGTLPYSFYLLDLVSYGVGYHHAGLDARDRHAMENMFIAGELPVLCKWEI